LFAISYINSYKCVANFFLDFTIILTPPVVMVPNYKNMIHWRTFHFISFASKISRKFN